MSSSSKSSSRMNRDRDRVKKGLEKHKHRRIKRKAQKHTLHFSKFVEHVETRHHYYVVSVIVDSASNTVKFIECRTPIRQKTFFVYISPKYIMKPPEDDLVRLRIRYLKDETPSLRNKEFIASVRGKTVKSDMLVIASDMVYFVTEQDGMIDIRCFGVGDIEEDEPEVPKKENKIRKITDDIKKIAMTLGVDRPSTKHLPVVSVEDLEESAEDDIDIIDADDEPYDPVKSAMNTAVGGVIIHKDETGKITETVVEPTKPLETPTELPKKPKLQRNAPEEDDKEGEEDEILDDEPLSGDDIDIPEPQSTELQTAEPPSSQDQPPSPPEQSQPLPSDHPTSPQEPLPIAAPIQSIQSSQVQSRTKVQPVVSNAPNTPNTPNVSNVSNDYSESDESDIDESDESDIDEDNEIPDIEEEGIVLGMTYIVIEVHLFFLKIGDYEMELAESYAEIEENEQSMRKTKVERIISLADGVRDRVTSWFEKQSAKEATIKASITSLSVAILQITSIKQRIENNPQKYRSNVVQEISRLDELYASSRELVRDQTVKLLKIRDIIENVLYESTDILEKSTNAFHDYLSDDE